MGKIFCLMGKSACGKDTIYKHILSDGCLPLKTLIPYTTRPIRDGETNGVEYYFLTDEEQQLLEREGKIIELRAYQTMHGLWKYFTVNDHQLNLADNHYLIIGTLESYVRLQEYFGNDYLVPLYIELESRGTAATGAEPGTLTDRTEIHGAMPQVSGRQSGFLHRKAGICRYFHSFYQQ